MLLGPKDFRRGQRDDNARVQKLERQVEALMKRVGDLEANAVTPVPLPAKRGPGRPPKQVAA